MKPHNALIIDDLDSRHDALPSELLAWCNVSAENRQSWKVFSVPSVAQAPVKLVIANAVSNAPKAIELFRWLCGNPAPAAVFGILPPDDPDLLRLGAEALDDFLVWPVHGEEFRQRITRLMGAPSSEGHSLEGKLLAGLAFQNIVGRDPAFVEMLGRLAQFAASEAPVLLNGETGTGKELCARAIHTLSARRNGPFIPVECGALPEQLLENEVFGHLRGAYTGAVAEQKGLAALARGGTLFLDEIDGVTPGAQGKLLRLLQEGIFRPLGAEKFTRADIRVVAASNADLSQLVERKMFRADLFFRLNVLRVTIPPLRQRRGDIALLAKAFIDDLRKSAHGERKTLSQGAVRKLESYRWPGNVRELHNTIHRAVLTSPGSEVRPCDLEIGDADSGYAGDSDGDFRSGRAAAIEAFEGAYVRRLIEKHDGNVTRAAREARKERRAFGRLVKKYSAVEAIAVGQS